jgi:hypothetical protein
VRRHLRLRLKRLTFILLASLGGLLFLALGLIVFCLIAISTDTEAEIAADTVPMRALIQHTLARGATLARTLVFLHSPAIAVYRRAHGFTDPYGFYIDTAFVRVPSFDQNGDQAQAYPQGKAVLVTMEHYSGMRRVWGLPFISRSDHKRLAVWLFFDRAGRYTHCQMDEVYPAL